MGAPTKSRRRRAVCAICNRPIEAGDAVRGLVVSPRAGALPTHLKCYERDWETIESGLEPFPRLVAPPPSSSYGKTSR
jgi:hypothetical protein